MMAAAHINRPDRGQNSDGHACSKAFIGGCVAHKLGLCEGRNEVAEARQSFAETSPRFLERKAAARRTIFRSGAHTDGFPIVCRGWAAVIGDADNRRRQIISFLLPTDLVSGSLLFEDKLHFTIEAITDVTYHIYDRAEFRAALTAKSNLFEIILKSWAEENLKIAKLAVSLGLCSAEERIARLIMKLSERLAKHHMVKNHTFYFPLRQQHIAEYTGLTPVHVSNVLGQLRRKGLIELKDRSLTIRDPKAFQRICNY